MFRIWWKVARRLDGEPPFWEMMSKPFEDMRSALLVAADLTRVEGPAITYCVQPEGRHPLETLPRQP